jgi:putative membrane protein
MLLSVAWLLDERPRPTVPYEFSWSFHPSVLIGTALLGALYFWGIGPARRRWSLGPPATPWQVASFVAGLAVLLVSLNGPLHDLSDYYLFSVHMLQHLLLTLLFPPLLIAGTPGWLLAPLVRRPGVARVGRFLARPLVAALLYSVVIAAWHTIPAYDLMMRNHEVHVVTHLMFIVAAVIMWWPVMSPVPEVPRMPLGLAMLYLFLVSIPMQLVAAIITMSGSPLYLWYEAAPRTLGLSPLDDQKVGGLLMWVPGNLWMFGAIAILFFLWNREEPDPAKSR